MPADSSLLKTGDFSEDFDPCLAAQNRNRNPNWSRLELLPSGGEASLEGWSHELTAFSLIGVESGVVAVVAVAV